MVNIQFISDTHLEFRGENFQKIIKPSAPILCMLGDICACGTDGDFDIYKKFITYLSPLFTHIFHIPGNHEYYTVGNKNVTSKDTMQGIDSKIRKFTKSFTNVHFLNNDTVRLQIDNKKYVFVGSTLWTNVSPENKKKISSRMNDYSYIYFNNPKPKDATSEDAAKMPLFRRYNINDMVNMHEKSVRYIKKIMKTISADEIAILLTHHKPISDSDDNDEMNQAYESDLKDIIIKSPFKLAAHGHTHKKYDKVINDVRVISNPKGYISQKTKFDDKFIVTL